MIMATKSPLLSATQIEHVCYIMNLEYRTK